MTFYKDIDSLKATEQLAKSIASNLIGGEVIELVSDVGGGKTTFTKYLVASLGSSQVVSSPTFTVSKQYATSKFTIHHYDFYRLNDPDYVTDALAETVNDPNDITVIEWGGLVDSVLPSVRIKVTITKHPTIENSRHIVIETPPRLDYILKGIV